MTTTPWQPDDSEALGDALHATRKIRLGLEVIWSEIDLLPDQIPATDDVRNALRTISDWLQQAERAELRDALLTRNYRNYAAIKPLSLASPPSPASLADITAAMLVLQRHAVLITDD